MKKPYIKKFAKISEFTVWIVDGKYIRGEIDEEFTNCGQYYEFKFIPKKEIWIDKERVPGEEKYYIDSMLVMNRLMTKGVNHKEAVKRANAIEKRERAKSGLINNIIKSKKKKEEFIKIIHKKILKRYSSNVKVWIVKGEIVRDLFFIDFTEGGHDKVYSFIPSGEVWIDDDLLESERKYVILHELHERALMANGMSYTKAHLDASSIEEFCRQNPGQLQDKLKEAIEKNKALVRNGNGTNGLSKG